MKSTGGIRYQWKRILWDEFQKNFGHVRKVYAVIALKKGGNPKLGKYYHPVFSDATIINDKDVRYWIDVLVAEGDLKPDRVKSSDIYTNESNPSLLR
jgi:hypothetical protein